MTANSELEFTVVAVKFLVTILPHLHCSKSIYWYSLLCRFRWVLVFPFQRKNSKKLTDPWLTMLLGSGRNSGRDKNWSPVLNFRLSHKDILPCFCTHTILSFNCSSLWQHFCSQGEDFFHLIFHMVIFNFFPGMVSVTFLVSLCVLAGFLPNVQSEPLKPQLPTCQLEAYQHEFLSNPLSFLCTKRRQTKLWKGIEKDKNSMRFPLQNFLWIDPWAARLIERESLNT